MSKKQALVFLILASTSFISCNKPIKKGKEPVSYGKQIQKDKHNIKNDDRTLFIYLAFSDSEVKKLCELFKKESGILIKHVRKSTGELFKLAEAQKDVPLASVLFGGPAPFFIDAKQKGLLVPYKSPYAAQIPKKFKDPQHYWTGIYTGIIGFVTNTNAVKNPPKSWGDLLKKEYKGKIFMANPNTSGTAYTILVTLVQLMGEEKAFEYMKKLDKQIFQYTTRGPTPTILVKLGIAGITICFAHDALSMIKKDSSLVLTFPEEGTGWEIGGVAIVKNAPDMNFAKKFVDFVLSLEGQNSMVKTMTPRFPTNPKANIPEEAKQLKNIKLIHFDFERAGNKKEYLLTRWNKEVLKNE